MCVLVQGAVPKSNSEHCLLLLYFMLNCVICMLLFLNDFYFVLLQVLPDIHHNI